MRSSIVLVIQLTLTTSPDTDTYPDHLRFRETATTIIAPLMTSWMLVLYPIVKRPNWTIPIKLDDPDKDGANQRADHRAVTERAIGG
jgi:hypothetical protein